MSWLREAGAITERITFAYKHSSSKNWGTHHHQCNPAMSQAAKVCENG
jgi:hypothetical protein